MRELPEDFNSENRMAKLTGNGKERKLVRFTVSSLITQGIKNTAKTSHVVLIVIWGGEAG